MTLNTLLSRVTPKRWRRWGGGANADTLLAIDLGADGFRAVHVRREGQGLVVDGFRAERQAGDDQDLLTSLSHALELHHDGDAVALSLSSSDVVIRPVELPPMSDRELREALPWEARRHIAGLADDAVLEAQVLGSESGPSEGVLVAFPRRFYEDAHTGWTTFGVDPTFVDVGQLSALNACLRRTGARGDAPTALLSLGRGIACLALFSEKSLLLFRDVAMRLSMLDGLLGAAFNLEPGQLEGFKLSGKLPSGRVPAAGEVAGALADVLAELTEDLRSALLFLESRGGGTLDTVYWTGADAVFLDRQDLIGPLAARSGVTLEALQPFQGMRFGMIDEIGLKAMAAELAPVAGLAVRFFANGH